MSSTAILHGACFCGSVSYAVSGQPILSAYCHCTNCQRTTGRLLFHAVRPRSSWTSSQSQSMFNVSADSLTGCPFIHTIHYPASAFSWTHAAPQDERLDFYVPSVCPWKNRARCKQCGVNVASHNSRTGQWSVWGAHFERNDEGKIKEWDAIKPTAHIYYETRMVDMNDGLGKWTGYEKDSEKLQI